MFQDFKIETELDRKLLLGVLGIRRKEKEVQSGTMVTVEDYVHSVSTPL